MPAYASHFADFLIKKLGGLLLLVLGISLTALGLGGGATWLTVLGVLLAVGGAVLLVLSVLRLNRSGSP
jgi:hypothetical protein